MADPMLTLLAADSLASALTKQNSNFTRRFTPDVRSTSDANVTQLATDELIVMSATTAPRTLSLVAAASANSIFVRISAADGTNTVTIDPNGAELIDGASTKVYTGAKKLLLIPDGTGWTVWDMT